MLKREGEGGAEWYKNKDFTLWDLRIRWEDQRHGENGDKANFHYDGMRESSFSRSETETKFTKSKKSKLIISFCFIFSLKLGTQILTIN